MINTLASADRGSAFRLQRLSLTDGSFASPLDPEVEKKLKQLDDLLGKHVLRDGGDAGEGSADAARDDKDAAVDDADGSDGNREERRRRMAEAVEAFAGDDDRGFAIGRLLTRPLLPWRPRSGPIQERWPRDSLAQLLVKAADDPSLRSVSDWVDDSDPALSELKYDMVDQLRQNRWRLEPNVRAVLEGRDNIRDYLIARAWHVSKIRDAEAMLHHLQGNRAGARMIADYAAVSAARALVDAQRLRVPDFAEDAKPFSERIRAAGLSLASAAFGKAVRQIADDIMFNADAGKLIDEAGFGPIPPSIRAKLVAMIKTSPVQITADTVKYFLPHFIAQAYDMEPAAATADADEPDGADTSWTVQFQDTADPQVDVDRNAVRYAAQLFHGMVLGDELGLFDTVDYLIHGRMVVGGGMSVTRQLLREDLKLYAMSGKFRNLGAPGLPLEDRTRASERTMFARAVFDQGQGEVMEGMERNAEFRSLWQVLMLESARYLDRAQESYNPESFVSKQNVMQAVEDLQYNLSSYCVGWPQVIAPVVDAEINFVIKRFLSVPAVTQQVLPAGGSWKRVVDKLNAERPKKKPIQAAAFLFAKARQGLAIIQAIADYDPAAFEDEGRFSSFISLVDGYIATESKLQQSARRPVGPPAASREDEDEDDGYGRTTREPVANDDDGQGLTADHDEAQAAAGWDF